MSLNYLHHCEGCERWDVKDLEFDRLTLINKHSVVINI